MHLVVIASLFNLFSILLVVRQITFSLLEVHNKLQIKTLAFSFHHTALISSCRIGCPSISAQKWVQARKAAACMQTKERRRRRGLEAGT